MDLVCPDTNNQSRSLTKYPDQKHLPVRRTNAMGRRRFIMWNYEKRLQYPVNIKNTCPRTASLILSQFGGPDGELSASMRYRGPEIFHAL